MSEQDQFEELKKKLEEAGIDPGEWREVGGREFEPSYVRRQKQLLVKLKGVLQGMVDKDLRTLETLYDAQNRIKHGGGK